MISEYSGIGTMPLQYYYSLLCPLRRNEPENTAVSENRSLSLLLLDGPHNGMVRRRNFVTV
jgi:hypothetical protein